MQETNGGQAAEADLRGAPGLDDLIQQGARQILQQAIEAELATMREQFANVKAIDGRRAIVRNGYLPECEIVTAAGPVMVQVPKVRDRSGSGMKFNLAIVPPNVRKSPRVSSSLPWLYLRGISTGDMSEALSSLLGEQAKGLSANTVSGLKAAWADVFEQWNKRDLSNARWVYWWADGIHTQARTDETNGQCLLVIISVKPNGEKERVALSDGYRESKASRVEVLLDLKVRSLQAPPLLVLGDGAMGMWAALDEVFPQVRHQRCWFHKIGNVLNVMPKSQQGRAKAALAEIWNAATRAYAIVGFNQFVDAYVAKYSKAVEKLTKDRDALLAFYDFPAEHWQHVRAPNPIESTFATARHRTGRTHNCLSRATFLGMAFKPIEAAEQSWRKTRGVEKIEQLLHGIPFKDGIPVIESTPTSKALVA
uniref:IS256 family transposase n=1 Tax=Burkholderia arboris TaxID=488730 RepID=UPI003BEEFA98